ncbi:BadF/BadG/BcrA/BcrD ATPase family protein [Nesterenkonia sp. HG001]|uniref:BadF/BadG/BcrA/BcrD ATPase family protein n=1 Tax=Nesterenkonia sp. HG001 TaxID=2983207 RepID=UPI002AC6F58F|nr:BadF/BadG/BcrA/BcrD ATPase family protein [Nesterenkonia sp. HG001]MDZ5077992.1 hypothetical protein [Nesterenkonia sp. HG001]
MTLLGIDVGGSGSRAALLAGDGASRWVLHGPRVEVRPTGSTAAEIVQELIRRIREQRPADLLDLKGAAVGATGLASLVARPQDMLELLGGETRTAGAVAIDAVTAHLGALGGAGGAVTALGTGAITVSHPGPQGPGRWRRVDGWGHLLGDRGGGSWVGRRALETALRAHDGLDPAGAAILAQGVRRFGPPGSWPAQIYPRPDRAGVLASFAQDVVGLAEHDPSARNILREAGREAAAGTLAALEAAERTEDTPVPRRAALAGGLAGTAVHLQESFRAVLEEADPPVDLVPSQGDPLDGALRLARMVAGGVRVAQQGHVWT